MEILAESIMKISDASAKMLKSGLTRRAILTLIQDAVGGTGRNRISHADIQRVLNALPQLKDLYVSK